MDRRVVNVAQEYPERDRFLRGMVELGSIQQTTLYYARSDGTSGGVLEPSIRAGRWVVCAWMGSVSFSAGTLRVATLFAMFGFLYTVRYCAALGFFSTAWFFIFLPVMV